ncbi:MAG TPA: PAS domain S-box protein [Candidatus Omnitrophota bacterium]|nr:PAS domain S-box protein [Candidatus Omnitrophota bacterium]HPS20966.1 PAS domain S-box protein [Candidatus Omnitrophota bacterium]
MIDENNEKFKTMRTITVWSGIFLSLFLWIIAGLLEYLWFNHNGKGLVSFILPLEDPHELLLRSMFCSVLILAGIMGGQVLFRLGTYDKRLYKDAEELKASNQQLTALNQQLQATEQQLKASNQQLTASNQEIKSAEQQLQAANQQLMATNQQLVATEDKLEEDIERRKQLEEELSKFGLVIKNSSELISMATFGGQMTFLNKAGSEILGIPPDEVDKHTIYDIFSAEHIEFVKKEIIPCAVNKGLWEGNVQYLNLKTGARTEAHAVVFAVKDQDSGEPLFLANVSTDMTERKKNESKVISLQKQWEDVINFLPDATFALDKEGKVIVWNNAISEMTGVKSDGIIGKGDYEHSICFYGTRRPILADLVLLPDNRWESVYKNVKRIGDVLVAETFIENFRSSAGIYLWGIAKPLYDSSGEIVGVIESIRDITEMKKAQLGLEERELAYRTLAENIPGIIYRIFCADSGKMCFYNDALKEITGYLPEELGAGRINSIDPLILPEDRAGVIDVIKNAIQKNMTFEIQYRLTAKSGEKRTVLERGRPIFDHKGELTFIDGVILDITNQVRIQTELAQSETRYRQIVETASEGVWVSDQTGSIVFTNKSMLKMLGYKNESSIIGHAGIEYVYPEDISAYKEHRLQRMQGKKTRYEQRMLRADGAPVWCLVSATPIMGENGEFLGSMAMFMNIDDIKKAEKILASAKDHAEQANRAKSQFLANVSHDIRTPMNAIMGFNNMLCSTKLDEKQKKFVKIINDNAQNLLALIDDVLDMSRIESGKINLRSDVFCMKDIVETLMENTKYELGEKDVKLLYEFKGETVELLGDPIRIKQIFGNILNNAVKYTDKGEINVEMECQPSPDDRNKCLCRVSTRDTGIGIAGEYLENIFDPFTRYHETKGKRYKGVGLGLYITRTLVRLMGGEITVRSEEGIGSEFVFTLKLPFA